MGSAERRANYLFMSLPKMDRLEFAVRQNLVREEALDSIPLEFWRAISSEIQTDVKSSQYYIRKLERLHG